MLKELLPQIVSEQQNYYLQGIKLIFCEGSRVVAIKGSRVVSIRVSISIRNTNIKLRICIKSNRTDPEYTIAQDPRYISGVLGAAIPDTKYESELTTLDPKYILEPLALEKLIQK
ncbi:2652_t:CDS:1, partial [Racocetra fulgida]